MKTTTAVAISGGIDSLMAAHLLKKQDHRVVGLHFLTGYETRPIDIAKVAGQLGIEYHLVDLRSPFSTEVVDYFIQTYRKGKTPNPCLVCNPLIKFGYLLQAARELGADRLATGHYARLRQDADGTVHLLRGKDNAKDQSYFLAFVQQKQLALACFPLGSYRKSEVKAMAAAQRYRPATRSESQDACFIKEQSYCDFLEQHTELLPPAGDIVNLEGRVLGRHQGLHRYTIGQRRGLNCPAAAPYYVVALDTGQNRLVVGSKTETLSAKCLVEKVNWIRSSPQLPMRVNTRLRYRHKGAPSTLEQLQTGELVVHFDEPQSAITPGQGAVFYDRDEVVGGGFIT